MTHYTIDIISDTVCPFCYLGHKRLTRAIATHKARHPSDTFSTAWHAFYLDPSAPARGEDKQARYARRFGADRAAMMHARMAAMGRQEGIDFKFGGRTGNTRDSHRVVALAATKGEAVQTRVVEELFAGYFEHERDITDRGFLVEAAVRGGLDEGEVKGWLESGKGGDVVDREVEAAQRRFVSGVPHFTINGKWVVGGAEDPQTFLGVFEEVKKAEGK